MPRDNIILQCTECKERNYVTTKNKKNTPNRLELNKFCRRCRCHRLHKENKQLGISDSRFHIPNLEIGIGKFGIWDLGVWCQWLAWRSPKPQVRVRVLLPLPERKSVTSREQRAGDIQPESSSRRTDQEKCSGRSSRQKKCKKGKYQRIHHAHARRA